MWTFGKKIAVGFAMSFVLLIGIGSVAYRSIETLASTSQAVAHTHVVLEHLAGVLGAMKDAETGQRGFVITGDPSYLDPYDGGTASVTKSLAELRQLTSDNSAQQRRLDDAERFVAERLAELKQPIDARRSAGFDPAQKIITQGAGKKTMDELRRVLDAMDREERMLLKQRADDVEASATNARTTILGGTLLSLVLVTAIGFVLTRTLSGQIGAAVRNVEGSSTELHAAATQQATGARESATSMS